MASTPELSARRSYDLLHSLLSEHPAEFSQIQYIHSAKVPIIKFVYVAQNLHFDLTVNKFDGLHQLKEVEMALKVYPEMRYLIFLNKCMLKQRELS